MRRNVLFVVALFLRACFGGGGTPAWAAFTSEEATAARHAHGAALANVNAGVIYDPTCLGLIYRAQRDTLAVALSVYGGYPEIQAGSPVTRADQLAKFRDHRARALYGTLPDALTCVERQLAKRGTDPLKVAADQLRLAMAHLDLVDPALAYADPTPQPLLTMTISDGKGGTITVTQTEPAVVGPHGLYYRAIGKSFWKGHYSLDMMEHGVIPLLSRNTAKRAQFREIVGLYRQTRLWQLDTSAREANVWPDPGADLSAAERRRAEDRFCNILYVADTLTNGGDKPGLPLHYFALMLQIQKAVSDDPVVQRLLQSHSDLWHQTDMEDWFLFAENEPLRKRCIP